jgi:2-polyprenyl-6-methoxyphenol hydroxylase-like FAD-dependent oxidoreductase
MHPRTLEVLRPLGVVDALLARGEASPRTQLHLAGRNVSVSLGDFELSDTPFPYMLLIRQADIEAVLTHALTDRGIQVERGSELLDPGSAEQPVATIARHGTAEHVRYRYLAGCDGAKSTVRIRNDIGWQGGRYQQEVVLADIEMIGVPTPDVAHLYVGRDGMLFLFRIGEHATWRIMATRPASSTPPDQAGRAVSISVLQTLARAAGLDATVTRIGWSEVAPLEHRLATQYRRGRVFLVGDAAHVHSPAGAQGMNTGVQDATNLGWKVAFATNSHEARHEVSTLLRSYEQERRPVARTILAMTHTLFWAEAADNPVTTLLRGPATPLIAQLLPPLLRQRRLVSQVIKVLSGLRVHYRHSPLSIDEKPALADAPRPGDRLPDSDVTIGNRSLRLHRLVAQPGVHVLLRGTATRLDLPFDRYLHVHRVTNWPGAGILIVRPDGYVGYRAATVDPQQCRNWLALLGIPQVTP